MGKRIGEMFRDAALVMLTFMPGLFAYVMILYIFYQDPVFAYWSGKVVAPLLSSLVVCFFGGRYKVPYKLLQALLLFALAFTCSLFIPVPEFVDPTKEGSMGPVFTFVGIEIALLIVGKILLDFLIDLFPGSREPESEEPEPFYT